MSSSGNDNVRSGNPIIVYPDGVSHDFAGHGSNASVGILNDHEVLKYAILLDLSACDETTTKHAKYRMKLSAETLEREKDVYRRLGSHPNIVQYLEISDKGIRLEYIKNGTLRNRLQSHADDEPIKLAWARQVTSALQYLHQHDIFWADLSARNCLVTDDLTIKVCDFGGSSLGDQKEMVGEKTRYYLVHGVGLMRNASFSTELFALGSLFYEIMTNQQPYPDLEDREIERLYQMKQYAPLQLVKNEIMRDVVARCWHGAYRTCAEVLMALPVADPA
ncbi:MAG: hypothetical protein M4579_003735 [Chaenotheca gracillima]|nr:MAG: hypothetical protein M4579_003735 [Chaenotheca gracillima]